MSRSRCSCTSREGGADEDTERRRTALEHLMGTLHVDLEHDVLTFARLREPACRSTRRGSVPTRGSPLRRRGRKKVVVVDKGVGVFWLAWACGHAWSRTGTAKGASSRSTRRLDDRAFADPAGAGDDEDQGRSTASSSASRCLAPRPWSRRVSADADVLHEAASLDLAGAWERFEHGQHLHLADDLVRSALTSSSFRVTRPLFR